MEAPMPNRSVAADAATAREGRWKTATAYAKTPTPQTIQERRDVVGTLHSLPFAGGTPGRVQSRDGLRRRLEALDGPVVAAERLGQLTKGSVDLLPDQINVGPVAQHQMAAVDDD